MVVWSVPWLFISLGSVLVLAAAAASGKSADR
jgi:hypothetical protein